MLTKKTAKETSKFEFTHSYICPDCAEKQGATEGVAIRYGGVTWWQGRCPYCNEIKSLCGITDYKWHGKQLRVKQ